VDGHPASDFLVSVPPLAHIRATLESRDSNCYDYTHCPENVKEEWRVSRNGDKGRSHPVGAIRESPLLESLYWFFVPVYALWRELCTYRPGNPVSGRSRVALSMPSESPEYRKSHVELAS